MLISLSDAYIHLANNTGKIYSGSHNELISNNIGFYLSHDGFSLLVLQEENLFEIQVVIKLFVLEVIIN